MEMLYNYDYLSIYESVLNRVNRALDSTYTDNTVRNHHRLANQIKYRFEDESIMNYKYQTFKANEIMPAQIVIYGDKEMLNYTTIIDSEKVLISFVPGHNETFNTNAIAICENMFNALLTDWIKKMSGDPITDSVLNHVAVILTIKLCFNFGSEVNKYYDWIDEEAGDFIIKTDLSTLLDDGALALFIND